jgi:hypothetical protein
MSTPMTLPSSLDMLGIMSVFLVQIGARHLVFDFSHAQRKIISHPIVQALILFGMFYVSTRSIMFATMLFGVYYSLILVFFNEKHPWNVLSRNWLVQEGLVDKEQASPIELYYQNISKLPKAW